MNPHRHTAEEFRKPPRLHCRTNGRTRLIHSWLRRNNMIAARARERVDARRRRELIDERNRRRHPQTKHRVRHHPDARQARHQRRGQHQDRLANPKLLRIRRQRTDLHKPLQPAGKPPRDPPSPQLSHDASIRAPLASRHPRASALATSICRYRRQLQGKAAGIGMSIPALKTDIERLATSSPVGLAPGSPRVDARDAKSGASRTGRASWSAFPSRIRSRSETGSLAQDGVRATSPCSGHELTAAAP